MSGWLGDLSTNQAAKLEKFRQNLQDVLKEEHDDHCLLRFLRAREFNLKESEAMFRKAVAWRESMKVDAIFENFLLPEVCEKYWCGGFVGHDKEGSPIYVAPIGKIDIKGLMHSCKTSEMVKTNIYYLEMLYRDLKEQSKKLGRNVEGMVLLYDFEGLGVHHLWKPGIDLFNDFLTLFEQYYPETIKVSYVLKPPKIFPIIYALVKPFLRERTKAKIKLLGSDWKEVLLQHIDADTLPEHWGGTRRDPDGDPKCPSLVKPAGIVPESYFIKDMRVDVRDTTTITVARGRYHQLRFIAKKRNSALRYEFMTKKNNIDFGVTWLSTDAEGARKDDVTVILPVHRHNSHLVPESGELELERPGTYVVTFDNRFSWTTTKTVTYSIQILDGNGDNGNDDSDNVSGEKSDRGTAKEIQ